MGVGSDFVGRVARREVVVGVVGLGYVGLPTAIKFYDAGFTVWGIDNSQSVVSALAKGVNPTSDPELDGKIPTVENSRWNVGDSFQEAVPQCDVIIVTVPTPVSTDKQIDVRFVTSAGDSVFKNINGGSKTIVILESTVYPGLTRSLWIPLARDNGLELGDDVELAYCPERHNPGDSQNSIGQTARIIGSMDPEIGGSLVALYSTITEAEVRFVGQMEVAESAKLIENVQRDINIALVNELAMILPKLDVDIEQVLEAASTKWNFHRYTPGIGVGGHCIPVDPYFLIDQAHQRDSNVHLISSARMINDHMPTHVANEIERVLDKHGIAKGDRNVLILGWSYKPEIGDVRGSPSSILAGDLISRGISVCSWDPFVSQDDFGDGVEVSQGIAEIKNCDAIILATAHDEFISLDWNEIGQRMRNKIIYDGRRCLNLNELEKFGWHTYAIGRP